MASEGIEVVRAMYAAFHAGEYERALGFFDKDVEFDTQERVDGGSGRGREAMGVAIGEWISAFDDWSEEIESLSAVGERVVAVVSQTGRSKSLGIQTEARYGALYETRDGCITRISLFNSPEEAAAAAGAD